MISTKKVKLTFIVVFENPNFSGHFSYFIDFKTNKLSNVWSFLNIKYQFYLLLNMFLYILIFVLWSLNMCNIMWIASVPNMWLRPSVCQCVCLSNSHRLSIIMIVSRKKKTKIKLFLSDWYHLWYYKYSNSLLFWN